MVTDQQLLLWIAAWFVIGGVLVAGRWRTKAGVGLVPAFGLQMLILHWLAAAIYLLPWYWNLDLRVVFAGLREATWAMGGFTIGVLAIGFVPSQRRPFGAVQDNLVDRKLIRFYLVVGVVCYFGLTRVVGTTPTLSAIVNVASTCAIVGIVLACWNANHQPGGGHPWWWLTIAALLPFVTIAVQGFIGYGLAAAVVIFAFAGSFSKPMWKTIGVSVLAAYLGMSLYVTYMRDRTDIREVVWGGESATARFNRLSDTFLDLELFDIYNVDHLQRVDLRLNQNYLVGLGVEFLDQHPDSFANGETILEAVLAPIPRALWPDKPSAAGSGDLVTRFTGVPFAEGTSVGIGQVMELYVNFGTPGVVVGFIVLGALLGYVDARAAQYRDVGDWHHFTLWFLPGLSLLQLGGSLVEVTSSAAAAVAVAIVLKRFAPRQRPIRLPAPEGPRIAYARR
ncbi:MAG TPA: hypothetical protein VF456_07780 [Vicinamibacterales bacterium]